MKLSVPILLNCVFVTLFYLLEKKTKFKNLNYISKQIIIGVVFGGLSAFASGYGVQTCVMQPPFAQVLFSADLQV